MRVLFIMAAVIAVLAGGGFLYWTVNPSAFVIGSRVPPTPGPTLLPPATAPLAETCKAEDAHYYYRKDANLTLRLEQAPPGTIYASGADAGDYTNVGSLLFVVRGYDREFRFVAAQSKGVTMSYLFPMTGERRVNVPRGVDLLQMSAFDSDYTYYTGLPALEHAAPAHIIVPNLSRYFYDHGGAPRIEEPPGFFDFAGCDKPPRVRSVTVMRPAP